MKCTIGTNKIVWKVKRKTPSFKNSWNHKSKSFAKFSLPVSSIKVIAVPIALLPMKALKMYVFILCRFGLDGFSYFRLFSDDRLVINNWLFLLDNTHPREHLLQALQVKEVSVWDIIHFIKKTLDESYYLSVFRMGDGIDEGIVGTGCLCQNDWNGRHQWSNFGNIAPGTHDANNGKWSPGSQPHWDVHDGNLGNSNLCRNLLLVVIATERSNIHLLSLSTELFLVLEYGMNDEVVTASNNSDWQNVVCEGGSQNVGLVVHVLGDVVIRAPVDCHKRFS